VSIWQAWLLVGLPSLLLGLTLFVGRSPWRAGAGYAVLAAGFGGMAVVDRASAAVLGGLLSLLFAAGRGGATEVAGAERRREEESAVPGWAATDRTLKPGINDREAGVSSAG
jgi:hypothetical protein